MKDINKFFKENINEDIIYERNGEYLDGNLEKVDIENNKLRILLGDMEIIIDDIIDNLSFIINDNELSISNNNGIHIFYTI